MIHHSAEVQNGDLSSWVITFAEHRWYKAKFIKTWDHHSFTKEYKLSLDQVDIKNTHTHTNTILCLLHIYKTWKHARIWKSSLKLHGVVSLARHCNGSQWHSPYLQEHITCKRWANILYRKVSLLPSLMKGKKIFFFKPRKLKGGWRASLDCFSQFHLSDTLQHF